MAKLNVDPAAFIIVSAPSGAGKDSVIEGVQKEMDKAGLSVSATTRAPREKTPGIMEVHGVDYFFLSHGEFESLRLADGFLECAEVHEQWYGTPIAYIDHLHSIGCDIIFLNIDPQGAASVRSQYGEVPSIFILPPSAKELRRRLERRNSETPEKVYKRLRDAVGQISRAHEYDIIIVNDRLEDAVSQLSHIVAAKRTGESLRAALERHGWKKTHPSHHKDLISTLLTDLKDMLERWPD